MFVFLLMIFYVDVIWYIEHHFADIIFIYLKMKFAAKPYINVKPQSRNIQADHSQIQPVICRIKVPTSNNVRPKLIWSNLLMGLCSDRI
jgi:hypothetical protein